MARRFVRAQRTTAACCAGRSEAQCHVLGELARSGPRRLTELSSRLGADKGWTSRAVTAMEADGLLARAGQGHDGRAVTVALTPAGAARWRAIDGALDRHATGVLARLPPGERALVERALGLLRVALTQDVERARPSRRRAIGTTRPGRSTGRRP